MRVLVFGVARNVGRRVVAEARGATGLTVAFNLSKRWFVDVA